MSNFAKAIEPHVTHELLRAKLLWDEGQRDHAFRQLEIAHILGQTSTVQHVRTHWHMLLWGLRGKSVRESIGQVTRIIGAAAVTPLGFVPVGNTGGSNVSPFIPMPVPQELADTIASAKQLHQ